MRNKFVLFCCILLSVLSSGFKLDQSSAPADQISVWKNYDKYKEATITNRMFKHEDILPLIKKHTASGLLRAEILGNSVEGRSISHLIAGTGKTRVLLWSQMHGDESTATMALFDIFNFLSSSDENNSFRKEILDKLEMHFVPMLNPDGAEAWKRRDALEIDINRDARLLNTPEGRALSEVAAKVKPEFGFNLHDQSMLYSAGPTSNTATISFLAPAYNYEKDMNSVRSNATKLIVAMNRMLQVYAPGKAAKYNDDHDPRCFGDTFQKNGISTVLIESGGYPNDPDKQFIRKLNFYVILGALHSIATGSYTKENIDDYNKIPENSRSLYDVLIKNAEIKKGDTTYRSNIGINRSQIVDAGKRSMSYRGNIDEIADMDRNFGYVEADASGLTTIAGKIKTMSQAEWSKLSLQDEIGLAREGFLYIKFSDGKSPYGSLKNHLLNLTNSSDLSSEPVGLGQPANFLLTKNNKPEYAVINGFLIDFKKDIEVLPNSYGY